VFEIHQYTDRAGRRPFDRWFQTLDNFAQVKIAVSVDRLERGNVSTVKSIGSGVFELRLDFGPGYRVYFGRDGERIVILLGSGTKKRQQADTDAARALWQEYKDRKREE
jgi:putative addiction module killer protein